MDYITDFGSLRTWKTRGSSIAGLPMPVDTTTGSASAPISEHSDIPFDPNTFPEVQLLDPYFVEEFEGPEVYANGGFLPIILGDTFAPLSADDNDDKSGTLEVVYKLGHGAFGSTWLVYDANPKDGWRWKALKVLKASASLADAPELEIKTFFEKSQVYSGEARASTQDLALVHGIALPIDNFAVRNGPDTHLCLVLPLLGATLGGHVAQKLRFDQTTLKDICFQLARCMAHLHKMQIVHADFRPSNVCIQLKEEVNRLSREQMLEYLGDKPKAVANLMRNEYSSSPAYFVHPNAIDITSPLASGRIAVIDMGLSFRLEDGAAESPRQFRIPFEYCAPETTIYGKAGYSSDVWSLACTMFEVFTGEVCSDPDPITAMQWLENLNGPLPASYRPGWAEKLDLGEDASFPMDDETEFVSADREEMRELEEMKRDATKDFPLGPTKYMIEESIIFPKWYYVPMTREEAAGANIEWHESRPHPPERAVLVEPDATSARHFFDLIRRMLLWMPADRISADDVLTHPFFQDVVRDPHDQATDISRLMGFTTVGGFYRWMNGPSEHEATRQATLWDGLDFGSEDAAEQAYRRWWENEVHNREWLVRHDLVFGHYWSSYVFDFLRHHQSEPPEPTIEEVQDACWVMLWGARSKGMVRLQDMQALSPLQYVARCVCQVVLAHEIDPVTRRVHIADHDVQAAAARAWVYSVLMYRQRMWWQMKKSSTLPPIVELQSSCNLLLPFSSFANL